MLSGSKNSMVLKTFVIFKHQVVKWRVGDVEDVLMLTARTQGLVAEEVAYSLAKNSWSHLWQAILIK